jgi:hypothetical protein
LFGLALEENLGYDGNGEYGFDTVGLQIQNSGGPILEHQIVAGKFIICQQMCICE